MSLVTRDYKSLQKFNPDPVPKGLDAAANTIIGGFYRHNPKVWLLHSRALNIHRISEQLRNYSYPDFVKHINELRDKFRQKPEQKKEVVDQALGAISEAAERTLGLRPYPVQIMGALAMYQGYLIEMATGEGKTLTACLPAVLAGWSRRPCQVITVNDYLASRDAQSMAPLYKFCSLNVGCVLSEMQPEERRENYKQGVVYVTSKEILADYLRDRLKLEGRDKSCRLLLERLKSPALSCGQELVMRGLHTAIVDEADSVLIDEAVTPLIISMPTKNEIVKEVIPCIQKVAQNLAKGTDYSTDEKYKQIHLTSKGQQKIEGCKQDIPGIWRGTARCEELVQQSLSAREFYHCEQQYVIQEGKVVIVDEFTGRLMPSRSWSHGLHQMIEAKEGLEFSDPTETLARLSFQRFFRLFYKLSGMTGTAREAAGEFWQIFSLPTVFIPTNKPCIRKEYADKFFKSTQHKWQAILKEIEQVHQSGRPILVGTRSVDASEYLARKLAEKGLDCQVLNAVRHEQEAGIVARAGEYGRITIATNMAGRGTDIKLGTGVAKLGGLHVIATGRHESQRIDRQLFGRCARQGDAGSSRAFVSLEDEVVRRFLPQSVRKSLAGAITSQLPGSRVTAKKAYQLAQKSAQRQAAQRRKLVLRNDLWFEKALSFSGKKSSL